MIKLNLVFVFLIGLNYLYAQTIINGNFESNSVTDCDYNNTNLTFNTKVTNVYSFGAGDVSGPGGFQGEVDIQKNNCFVTPQSGNWCLGISASNNLVNDADAIALQLTSNLIIGQSYQLSFYVYGNTTLMPAITVSTVKIGISNSNTSFGNLIYTATPTANIWKNFTFSFVATQNSNYLTVSNSIGNPSWNQIDNFKLINSLNVINHKLAIFNIYPNPFSDYANIDFSTILENSTILIYNCLGIEVQQIKNLSGKNAILNRNNLPEGLYLLQITHNNQIVGNSKLLISN